MPRPYINITPRPRTHSLCYIEDFGILLITTNLNMVPSPIYSENYTKDILTNVMFIIHSYVVTALGGILTQKWTVALFRFLDV